MKRPIVPLLAVFLMAIMMTTAMGNENAPAVQNANELNSANGPAWTEALNDGTITDAYYDTATANLEDANYAYSIDHGGTADMNLTKATFDYTGTFANTTTATTRAEGSGFSLHNEERKGVGDHSAAVVNDGQISEEATKKKAADMMVTKKAEILANTSGVIRA